MKYIALLDCNNFFVSCERLFRPDLINKPVVVLSSNDGCIVARSKEIKDIGIPMGVPYFQVKDTLNEIGAVSFSSHFALYRDISRRVFEVVSAKFSRVEQYSIDECFIELDTDEPLEFAIELKRQVEKLVGIPVSVSVASSKTQAKYVSTIAKKTTGAAFWNKDTWNENAKDIRLSEIWGVGRERTRAFTDKQILTVADLLALNSSWLGTTFGIEAVRLKEELLGVSILKVSSRREPQKSIMSSRSFANTTTDLSVLADSVTYHLYQGVKDLDAMDLEAGTLRVFISPARYSDYSFYYASSEGRLVKPTKDIFVLQKLAQQLLQDCYKRNIPYKKCGITLGNLSSPRAQTAGLFDTLDTNTNRSSLASKAMFEINQKHGKPLIQLGRTETKTSRWMSRKDILSPAYTTNWSELKVVH